MIAFDCPHCQKPLIVANRKAGSLQPCPGCLAAVRVPEPKPPSPWRGLAKPLVLLLALALGMAALGWKVYQDRVPARLRDRFVAALRAESPQWQGFAWEKCDPHVGDYKLHISYESARRRYAFVATCFVPAEQIFVFVEPTATGATALATLTFTAGQSESFRYSGADDEERDELESLAQHVARILYALAR